MAGMIQSLQSGLTTPPGTKYDPATGGYVGVRSGVQDTQNANVPYQQAYRSPTQAGVANSTANTNANATGADYAVDQYGNTSYTNSAASDKLKAQLQAEAEARRLAMFGGLLHPGGSEARITGTNPGEDAVRAQIFARSKDMIGQNASGALRGLQGAMAGRGVAGSGIEAMNEAQIAGGARGGLDNVITQQMIQDLNRAASVSDRNYAGDITQRGQDLNALPSILGLFTSRY